MKGKLVNKENSNALGYSRSAAKINRKKIRKYEYIRKKRSTKDFKKIKKRRKTNINRQKECIVNKCLHSSYY